MTVLNPKIENGYVTGIVYDKYNFDAIYKYDKDYAGTFYNNGAKGLQMAGRLKNYFIFIPIKIKL